VAQTEHPRAPLRASHGERGVQRRGRAVEIERIDLQCFAEFGGRAPNSLGTRSPSSSLRLATNSFATRFIPSRIGVTIMTSAAR
jgi:hypothetical protein